MVCHAQSVPTNSGGLVPQRLWSKWLKEEYCYTGTPGERRLPWEPTPLFKINSDLLKWSEAAGLEKKRREKNSKRTKMNWTSQNLVYPTDRRGQNKDKTLYWFCFRMIFRWGACTDTIKNQTAKMPWYVCHVRPATKSDSIMHISTVVDPVTNHEWNAGKFNVKSVRCFKALKLRFSFGALLPMPGLYCCVHNPLCPQPTVGNQMGPQA